LYGAKAEAWSCHDAAAPATGRLPRAMGRQGRRGVEGLGSGVYDGAVRFCPICDGFEAMDRRIGVLGSADEAGRKALFLRTYSRHVMLFGKEGNSEAMRETLRADPRSY
jgi:thioredoxin reductase